MKDLENWIAERKAIQQRVMEIIESNPHHYDIRKRVEVELSTPYAGGIVWYRGPINCCNQLKN
jgi:hypothetical protein